MRGHAKSHRAGRPRRSVFLKLTLIFLSAGLLIHFVVFGSFRYLQGSGGPPGNDFIGKNIQHYADHLISLLGRPPDRERAKALKDELGLDIRVVGGHEDWATSTEIPSDEQLGLGPSPHNPDVKRGWKHGRFCLALDRGGYRYYFYTPKGMPHFERLEPPILLLLLLTFVVAATYAAIRRVLKPLRALREGVRKLSEGELEHRIDVSPGDELGELAASFNTMTERIREMVRGREQLMVDVSHELRSPLTRMRLALELMDDGKSKRDLADDVSEMDRMIEEMLESYRIDSPYGGLKRESFDLKPILREIVGRYEGRAPGVRLSDLAPQILDADPDRLRTVIKNLVDNALKYSANAAQPVEISVRRLAATLEITVTDHGIGIPAEEIPHLFKPFYRVDKSRTKDSGGFGLGLSLCKKIVEAHAGTITLTSQEGQGTEVTVSLPLSPA